jgi:hypothetical protein
VIRDTGDCLEMEDVYQKFFEDVLEVNEEINVSSVRDYISVLNENIDYYLKENNESRKYKYLKEVRRCLKTIALATVRNVLDLKRNMDNTYKNEPNYEIKKTKLQRLSEKLKNISQLITESERVIDTDQPVFFSMVSMADFRYNHPEAEEAEFVSGKQEADTESDVSENAGIGSPEIVFEGKNLYHPFLGAKAVKNDFTIKDDNYYIITGANMAGKSTFLRSLGVNYILAMAGMPVFADQLKISRFRLFSSMRTTDNERNRRPKPCRHLHLRNLLHRIHHRSRINLLHLAIHSLTSVLFAKCQKFHSPVFAFSSQFLLQIPSSFDILHAQRRFPGKIPGECLRTARCDGSTDAVEQRTLAEDIEVEGIRMLRILIAIARFERREIPLPSLDFVLINLEQSRKMLYLLLVLIDNLM